MIPTVVHTFGRALKSEDGFNGDFKAMSLLLGDFVGRDLAEHRPRSSSGPSRRQFNLWVCLKFGRLRIQRFIIMFPIYINIWWWNQPDLFLLIISANQCLARTEVKQWYEIWQQLSPNTSTRMVTHLQSTFHTSCLNHP